MNSQLPPIEASSARSYKPTEGEGSSRTTRLRSNTTAKQIYFESNGNKYLGESIEIRGKNVPHGMGAITPSWTLSGTLGYKIEGRFDQGVLQEGQISINEDGARKNIGRIAIIPDSTEYLITYENGSTYVGEIEDGNLTTGKLTRDGSVFDGQFKNNLPFIGTVCIPSNRIIGEQKWVNPGYEMTLVRSDESGNYFKYESLHRERARSLSNLGIGFEQRYQLEKFDTRHRFDQVDKALGIIKAAEVNPDLVKSTSGRSEESSRHSTSSAENEALLDKTSTSQPTSANDSKKRCAVQ